MIKRFKNKKHFFEYLACFLKKREKILLRAIGWIQVDFGRAAG
jgi:hypothetical protein